MTLTTTNDCVSEAFKFFLTGRHSPGNWYVYRLQPGVWCGCRSIVQACNGSPDGNIWVFNKGAKQEIKL